MVHHRTPPPERAPYITAAGYDRLQQELKALWTRRAIVTQALAAAAAEGDRSENAEYIYRKKELREIDRRIRYLQRRLPQLQVVRGPPPDPTRAFFGATVTVEKTDGSQATYRIVGPDEFDAEAGCISVDAPLARALLKHAVNDTMTVTTPQGSTELQIVAISYAEN